MTVSNAVTSGSEALGNQGRLAVKHANVMQRATTILGVRVFSANGFQSSLLRFYFCALPVRRMDGAPSGQAEQFPLTNPSGAPRESNRGPLHF
eukprot:3914316-Prymnesium_polylepis.1